MPSSRGHDGRKEAWKVSEISATFQWSISLTLTSQTCMVPRSLCCIRQFDVQPRRLKPRGRGHQPTSNPPERVGGWNEGWVSSLKGLAHPRLERSQGLHSGRSHGPRKDLNMVRSRCNQPGRACTPTPKPRQQPRGTGNKNMKISDLHGSRSC